MRTLVIDVGNTRIKWGLGLASTLLEQGVFSTQQSLDSHCHDQWNNITSPQRVLISCVSDQAVVADLSQWCRQRWQVPISVAQSSANRGKVTNSYPKPTHLGVDRWIGLIAAHHLYPGDTCIIDCGTAITIDLIDQHGQHLGGMIAPGLQLMHQALTQNTRQINVSHSDSDHLLANNTTDAVSNGVFMSAVGLIEASVKRIEQQLGHCPQIVVTGGDGKRIMADTQIPHQLEPNLLLKGLLHYAMECS